jgi:DNA-binding MarR family transcriptional regulator
MKLELVNNRKQFSSQVHKAMIQLIFTHNWWKDKQQLIFDEYGLQTQHYNVLRIVNDASPNAISPSEIKALMFDKGADLTRIIDKLVLAEYVSRENCQLNRRRVDIKISKKGKTLLNEMNPKLENLIQKVQQSISEEEATAINQILEKIRNINF